MIRTDLALEAKEMYNGEEADLAAGVDAFEEDCDGIKLTFVEIKNKKGEQALGKAKGKYVTLQMPEFTKIGSGYYNVCVNCLTRQIKRLICKKENPSVLVAGLGNRKITSDSIGPLTVDGLIVTHHLKEMNLNGISQLGNISAIVPGVLGITGVESADVIKSICSYVKPDAVICIDSLVARNTERLANTIQLTDTGISPGSGIGNVRAEISENTIGVKVMAIGVPMVVEAATLAYDAIGADDEMVYNSIKEKTGDLIVAPKEADSLVSQMTKILSAAINLAFHNIPLEELYLYS
ncbi:MAG: GPR endopeptidase [Clostridia bacterium]|nr:GPR endopeptidase [Clostridia bacterium]